MNTQQSFSKATSSVFLQLSSLDEDESLIPDNSSGTSASLPTPRLPTFDDDSDEDLIL